MNRIGGRGEAEDSAAAELFLSCSLTWFHLQNNAISAVVKRIHSLTFLFLSAVRALLLLKRLSACWKQMRICSAIMHGVNLHSNHFILPFKERQQKKRGITPLRALKGWFSWGLIIWSHNRKDINVISSSLSSKLYLSRNRIKEGKNLWGFFLENLISQLFRKH